MATVGESSSSATLKAVDEKPVIVRVKRKVGHSPLDAFWLQVRERPVKRPLLDFEKLSISDSDIKEELKPKKVLVRHVETVTCSTAAVNFVQSFLDSVSNETIEHKTKSEERRQAFKQDRIKEQLLSKAVQQQQAAAKNARFEQIWRSRKGNKDDICDRALHDMCHFYDVLRVDAEERSTVPPKEDLSFEDQRMLASYLPLLREFIPTAAEEIESDVHSYMFKQTNEYVYDYYAVKDETNADDETSVNPFPLVQVEDEDFYDGPDDSEYDSDDSNAEDNPKNDYPDEISGEDDEEEEKEEDEESKASDESEDETSSDRYMNSKDANNEDDIYDDYAEDGYGSWDNEVESDGHNFDCRWSYR